MAYTLRWYPIIGATSYDIEKSVDKGASWSALATVAHDKSGANWSVPRQDFFYIDAAGASGHSYRQNWTDGSEVSKFTYTVAPPPPPELMVLTGLVYGENAAEVRVLYLNGPQELLGGYGYNPVAPGVIGDKSTRTSAEGLWQMEVYQGSRIRLMIPSTRFVHEYILPTGSPGPFALTDLIPVDAYPTP